MGWGERNQSTPIGGEGDTNQLASSGQKQHYITINEIFLLFYGTVYHLSQVNKVFTIPQLFNQHLYNIYKFKYKLSLQMDMSDGGGKRKIGGSMHMGGC